jgi:uncharacterized membrane-anchored protein YhcB (DUF1043 family)
MDKKKIYIIAGIGIVAIIGVGVAIYKLLKAPDDTKEQTEEQKKKEEQKPQQPVSIKTKIGTRLRKDSNTKSDIIKTYQKIQELKSVQSKVETDGTWYQVQELNSSGEVVWTGWVRSDVVIVK